MRFYADLHVHSKHARACSRHADLEHMAFWGALKGLDVIATGDFTHPAWLAELKEKLVLAQPGLFRLREDIETKVLESLPKACRRSVRFILSVEISTIYKKGERTRKIHHLIYVPDFAAADRLVAKLSRIGNLTADGRPILGLDARHLLEIALESSPDAFLIPAHIWTPWFAVLGSRAGFDSVNECYGDLAHHVFAVETGLSSDPEMNWRVSSLDRFRLISSSDAHSPQKLGREATLFDTSMDYFALRDALQHGTGYVGTVEFFPEEGKYHLDGHRKCNIRLTPEETKASGGRCPVCGDPVVIGVLNRVETLADRAENCCDRPHTAGEPCSFVPLPEILSELHGTGAASKKVEQSYHQLTGKLGTELAILGEVPVEDIARTSSSLLAEAIARLRRGEVIRNAGYDGEYGVIRLFETDELKKLQQGGLLFMLAENTKPSPLGRGGREAPGEGPHPDAPACAFGSGAASSHTGAPQHQRRRLPEGEGEVNSGLDADQQAAASITEGPLLVTAGPGSGKTRLLTHRIARLIGEGAAPEQCLAITFTRRAAEEMRQRLSALLPEEAERIPVHTFHSLGMAMLREHPNAAGLQRGFAVASRLDCQRLLAEALQVTQKKAGHYLSGISLAKRTGHTPPELISVGAAYEQALALKGWIDFDGLVALPVAMLDEDPGLAALYQQRFRYFSIDEYQDLDALQYRLVRLLAPAGGNLCAIGDPHQAIYGFRGADPAYFQRFIEDYPTARVVTLSRNYRSRPVIVTAASRVIAGEASPMRRGNAQRIVLHAAATAQDEASYVTTRIEALMGGHRSQAIHSGRAGGQETKRGFADFAVLYRTESLSDAVAEAFSRSGIPFRRYRDSLLAADETVQALLTACQSIDDGVTLLARLEQAASTLPESKATEIAKQKLMALAEQCGHDAVRFFEEAALVKEIDLWDARADAVALLTLHAAKGLEFPVVFIIGVEDGILPLTFGQPDAQALAEERRLFYVGMTRAQDCLYLTRAQTRFRRGAKQNLPPSPYLEAIESALLDVSKEKHPPVARPKQLALL